MSSISQIAAAWGCSRQAVSKWARKGMPTHSVAAASSWRLTHGERSARVKLLPAIPVPDPVADVAEEAPAALTDGESAEAVRDRARKAERVAYAMLQERLRAKDYEGIHASLKNYAVAKQVRDRSEVAFIKHQVEKGALVDRDSAISAQNRKLAAIKDHLLSLPAAAAKRANPTDPDMAALVLQEWVENTLRAVSEA
jgi:hypothetical protein